MTDVVFIVIGHTLVVVSGIVPNIENILSQIFMWD